MKIPAMQATQNPNSMIKPLSATPQAQTAANDVQAVASPTPVIAGAPTQTQQADSVELSNKNKKDKKIDKTLLLAFGIGLMVAGVSAIFGNKVPK